MSRKLVVLGDLSTGDDRNVAFLHTILVWKKLGVPFTLWLTERPLSDFRQLFPELTFDLVRPGVFDVGNVKDSVLACFDQPGIWDYVAGIKNAGCTTIWITNQRHLDAMVRLDGDDLLVCNSQQQADQITRQLSAENRPVVQTRVIAPTLSLESLPFRCRPHFRGQRFYIGRSATPHRHCWPEDLFILLTRCQVPVYGIFVGLNAEIRRQLGFQPPWIVCLKPTFFNLERLYELFHCFWALHDDIGQSVPYAALKAMAKGVPIVAPADNTLWNPFIVHNETGLIYHNCEELLDCFRQLAADEPFRHRLAQNARDKLSQVVDAERSAQNWMQLLSDVGVV